MESNRDSRTNPMAWLAITMVGVIAGLLAAGPAVAQGSAQFTYRVNHSVFGDIGTYTNIVEPSRDGITVKTKAHFEVKMLGVRLHREDAERTERWQGNRLVSFHGVTDKGEGPQEVKGEARGNNFVITSPQGNRQRTGVDSSGQSMVGRFPALQHDDAPGFGEDRAGAHRRRTGNGGEDRWRVDPRSEI